MVKQQKTSIWFDILSMVQLRDINTWRKSVFKEITHFFQTYKNLENKRVNVIGWKGLETAVTILQETKSRYIEQEII